MKEVIKSVLNLLATSLALSKRNRISLSCMRSSNNFIYEPSRRVLSSKNVCVIRASVDALAHSGPQSMSSSQITREQRHHVPHIVCVTLSTRSQCALVPATEKGYLHEELYGGGCMQCDNLYMNWCGTYGNEWWESADRAANWPIY